MNVSAPGSRRKREAGAALLVAMMLLAFMALIGFGAMDTVMRDRQVAGNRSLTQSALYAADAGVAEGLDTLRTSVITNAVTAGDCLTDTLPSVGLPNGTSYGPDPNATNQICMVALDAQCAALGTSINQGQPLYLLTYWDIRTEGQAPGGTTARVQATASRCHAFNN